MAGSLEGVLASIPGLAGYDAAQQHDQATSMNQLQQATGTMGLLAGIKKQQDDAEVSHILMSSPDLNTAVDRLSKLPHGIETAKHLVALDQAKQTSEALKGLSGPMSNDQLNTLGQRLAIQGHPGAATVMNIADKRTADAAAKASLPLLQGTPQGLPAGAPVPGTTQQTTEAIPQEDMAAFMKVANSGGQPTTATPQAGDVSPIKQDGVFSTLMASESPAIANRAKMLQDQLNSPQFVGSATNQKMMQDEANRLTQADQQFQQNKQSAADRAALKATPAGGAVAGATLPQDALDQAASRYLLDGTLPPNMGRGAQGTANTSAILARAAAMAKEKGMDGESTRISQIAVKALQGAVTGLERQRALVMAYEKTALAGADIALEMSDKVNRDTNIPIVDKWIQAGRKNVLGDPDVTRLQNAVETLTNEYAKVMSGSSGGQATTVSMQEHARQMLNAAQTKELFKGVVDLMKREMQQTREKAFDAQITELKGRMRPPSPSSAAPAPPAVSPSGWTITPIH